MTSKLITLAFALVALVAFGQEKPAYSDAEAAKHVGEEATVTGKVFTVSTSGKGTTFLNFGDRYPRHTFGGVVFAGNQAAVGDLKQYEGKEVAVTGRIEMSPDQKPQIVISRPDQIKLAGPANPPIPRMPETSAPATPSKKPTGKIQLASGWNRQKSGGDNVRKDLARLFGGSGSSSETIIVDTSIAVYEGIPFLTPLAAAKTTLHLGAQSSKSKVSAPGFPQDSFSAHGFKGIFPGGFDNLYLITDTGDQVVSVLLVDSKGGTRVANEPDTTGYHTYNFVSGGEKATGRLVVRHQIVPGSAAAGVVVVDTLLIDPTDPEKNASTRQPGSSSSKSSSFKPTTGKVLERARWSVPVPVVNLILRCAGG